jgi:hypothetical protein
MNAHYPAALYMRRQHKLTIRHIQLSGNFYCC